ncbi:heparin lyase I family protein [Streptomyces sp. NBC_00513]|uniref:heparin lyase I family protein n=1 Tax=unclassified Streptomyces TaxID=2593676 RepID=UPI0022555A2F|nr:heparin lyase I family protein [Streptomyces sp. NBC_00424]MCX5071217.1 heparin lyase I family protein [Streptomyces sp. NBC_00424]WUD45366.1 heparin lyase I family protein [Streptomyces sp. NBC_00513]
MPTALPPSFALRPARLIAACTATLIVAGVGVASPAAAADAVSYDFESPSQKLPFMAINGFGRVLVGPAPGGRGGQAARVNLPNDGRSFKSELVIKGLDAGSHRFTFANYLPGDWQERDLDTIVAQWFSMQGDGEGIKPVVALSVHGGNWQLKVHWMNGGEIQESVIPLGAARPGHWNQWAFDITWSAAGTPGSIAVTRDGITVGSHQGPNNYHRGEPPHFRIGAYRPNWRPEKGPEKRAGATEAVLYIDDIAINSTAPGSRSNPRPTTPATTSPSGSPTPSPSPASVGSPSPSASTQASAVPTGTTPTPTDTISPGATGQKPNTDGTTLPSTGSTGVITTTVASVTALAAGAYLLRRRNATRSARHRSQT